MPSYIKSKNVPIKSVNPQFIKNVKHLSHLQQNLLQQTARKATQSTILQISRILNIYIRTDSVQGQNAQTGVLGSTDFPI
jgi:hypothetical protein